MSPSFSIIGALLFFKHAAAAMRFTSDSAPFVRMLLEHGANPDLQTTTGQTALQIATEKAAAQERELAKTPDAWRKEYAGVIELLRQHGSTDFK